MKCPNCEKENITMLDTTHLHCPDCKTTFVIQKEGGAVVDSDLPEKIKGMAKKVDEMYEEHKARKEKEKNGDDKDESPYFF